MKLYHKEKIPNRKPIYYPAVAGFIFDDMPFLSATEANNMGRDLLMALSKDPDLIFDWEEKYGVVSEEI